MASTVNITKLAEELGTVIKFDQQRINAQTFVKTPTMEHMRTVQGVQRGQIWSGQNATVGEVSQAYQKNFTPKGDVGFNPFPIVQRAHKVDFEFFPIDHVGTWQGYLTDNASKGLNEANWPISRYLMFNLILPKNNEERELIKLYKGKYVAPTTNTAGPAVAAVNGLGEFIKIGLTDGTDYPMNGLTDIGALVASTVYEQVTTAVKQIDQRYRHSVPMLLFMSPDHVESYWNGREENIGLKVNTDDKNRNVVPNTMIQLVASPAMIGSGRFFITLPGNMVRILDVPLADNFEIQREKRKLNLLYDWDEAYGFEDPSKVWANFLSNDGEGGGDETEVFA